jgi:diguanylate cyclase (GGDEF)-like protein
MVMILGSVRLALLALVSDRASRLIAALGASVVACLVPLGAYLCLDLRDTAWRNAELGADNMLALIEAGVGRDVRLYDQSLREATRLAARPDIAALDPEIRRLAVFDTAMRGGALGGISITDAGGRIVLTSHPDTMARVDLGDLPEFAVHRDDPASGLIVAGPLRSRASGRMILRLTRRIEAPDGTFAGIASGAVFVDDFQALFERLRITAGSTINIFLNDGTLVVRAPYDPSVIGRSIAAGAPYRHFRAHVRGRHLGRSQIDGRERLFAFANPEGVPLIVTVNVSVESIRDAWVYKAGIVAALVACLSALTFGLTVLLQREVARRAEREATSRAANAALSELARTDGLTGLLNRRGYDEAFADAWRRAARTGAPLSLMLVDADRFKLFNDRLGHHRGDEVLRSLASCLRQTLSACGGIGCRVGGEEFAAILPGLDAAAAHGAAERVRRAVVNLQIAHAPEVGGVATVSVGLASAVPRAGGDPEALFAAADAALYAAKGAGRNRVRAAPPPESAAARALRA